VVTGVNLHPNHPHLILVLTVPEQFCQCLLAIAALRFVFAVQSLLSWFQIVGFCFQDHLFSVSEPVFFDLIPHFLFPAPIS
jgi:hypothetical protein